MMQSLWATVRDGQVRLLEPTQLPEGARLLITVLTDEDEKSFWLRAQEKSMRAVWDNPEDDVYGQLLQE